MKSAGISNAIIGIKIGKSRYETPIGPPFLKRIVQTMGKKYTFAKMISVAKSRLIRINMFNVYDLKVMKVMKVMKVSVFLACLMICIFRNVVRL